MQILFSDQFIFDQPLFRVPSFLLIGRCVEGPVALPGHREASSKHFRHMQRLAAGAVVDLVAAGGAVGDDERVGAALRTAGSSDSSPIASDTSMVSAP